MRILEDVPRKVVRHFILISDYVGLAVITLSSAMLALTTLYAVKPEIHSVSYTIVEGRKFDPSSVLCILDNSPAVLGNVVSHADTVSLIIFMTITAVIVRTMGRFVEVELAYSNGVSSYILEKVLALLLLLGVPLALIYGIASYMAFSVWWYVPSRLVLVGVVGFLVDFGLMLLYIVSVSVLDRGRGIAWYLILAMLIVRLGFLNKAIKSLSSPLAAILSWWLEGYNPLGVVLFYLLTSLAFAYLGHRW